jgi:beta-glucanase (GH16 family)
VAGVVTIVAVAKTPLKRPLKSRDPAATIMAKDPLKDPAAPSTARAPMPTGNPPGWRLVFEDDFTGTALDTAKWYAYSGHPSGQPDSYYDPSHVIVRDGMMVLEASRDPAHGGAWTTGGVSNGRALSQTYGRYEVRFRMDRGLGVTYTAMLWPSSNTWPPEIDFAEDDSAMRSTVNAFEHFAKPNGTDGQFVDRTSVNMTAWHTLGVNWTPGRVVYTIDGLPWATEANRYVSHVPMALDLETVAITCDGRNTGQCIEPSTPAAVDMDIDWVVEYAMNRPGR